MKARPILFSAPMIRALLDGSKTQTRRLVKPQPNDSEGKMVALGGTEWAWDDGDLSGLWTSPYGAPGDLLIVRETVRAEELANGNDGVRYLADDAWHPIDNTAAAAERWVELNGYRGQRGAKVVAIHMPRWASRLTLRLADVRVERLHDISDADAIAEGVVAAEHDDGRLIYPIPGTEDYAITARAAYLALWRILNGQASVDANPWVWVIDFKGHVYSENVDRVIAGIEAAARRSA